MTIFVYYGTNTIKMLNKSQGFQDFDKAINSYIFLTMTKNNLEAKFEV